MRRPHHLHHRGGMDPNTPVSTLPPPPPGAAEPPPSPPGPGPTAAPPPAPGETARSAALLLGGTGAFLILVAAAVLVAMRWDDIAAWMKVAGLLVTNVAVIGAGLRYRDKVPATAAALFHLGAFLVPISAVATTTQADLDWDEALLAASAATIATLSGLERVRPSKALPVVVLAAVVPFVGGVAAITGASAAVLLAVVALVGLQIRPTRGSPVNRAGLVWAGLAAAAAVLTTIDDPWIHTGQIVQSLGLGTASHPVTHVVAGAVAAVAFGLAAHRDDREGLAVAAVASLVGGAAGTLIDLDAGDGSIGLALVALAVTVESAAYAARSHRPWSAVFGDLAVVAEVGMVGATLWVTSQAMSAVDMGQAAPGHVAISAAILAVGWFVAGQRRRVDDCQSTWMALATGGGWWPATAAMAASVVAVAGAATAGPVVTAWTALATGAVLVATGRAGGHATTVALSVTAVAMVTTAGDAAAVAAAASLLTAVAASLRHTQWGAAALHLVSVGLGLGAVLALAEAADLPAAIPGMLAVLAVTVPTVIAERAGTDPLRFGHGVAGRALLTLGFVPAWFGLRPGTLVGAALLAVALSAVDVARTRDSRVLLPLAVTLPAALSLLGDTAGLDLGAVGVGLALAAVTIGGVAVALDRRDGSLTVIVVAAALSALVHATADPGSMSTTLLILGGAGVAVAGAIRSVPTFVGSAAVVAVGLWARLDLLDVTWSEPYLAPAAAVLVVLGLVTPPDRLSSWWTHGAATALVGGAGLVERMAGGHGGHGLIAGVVAVTAIALGASTRRIGPLAVGTALVVGVAGHEALAYSASVPTWAWLAGAGAVLLGCAVLVERTATSPLEGGRRLLDTVRAGYR